MKRLKKIIKNALFLGFLCALCSPLAIMHAQDAGLGDAAASLLGDYSSDALMDELLNSPFLSEEDRKQLEQMSPEEQAKLFEDVVGIFNDPEFQAILNDPEFAKQMEEVGQMFDPSDFDSDFDWDSLPDDYDLDDTAPSLPTLPTKADVKATEPQKPTKEDCQTTAKILQKIIEHLTSLEQKAPHYESIEQYVDVFKTKINEFKFYLELLQKPENLEHLASEDYASLNRSLCKLQDKLATFEPEILLEEKPRNEDLYDPYDILGVHRSATDEEITGRYEKIYQEKSPEHMKERLMVKDLDKKKLRKKLKEAEITFEVIQKAYDDLMDEEYRQEIDRILEAERRREIGLEQLAQQAIWEIIRALDEVFFSPGTILKETKELLEQYDAQALEKLKLREEEERAAAKKIEEYAKKQPRLTPIPAPAADFFDYPYGYPYGDRYTPPSVYDGYRQGVTPAAPARPGEPSKPDAKKPDDKKKDDKKDDKKEGKKKDDKKPDKKKEKKKEEEQDPVIKSLNELDNFLIDIEGGKKGKITDEKRQEFVDKLKTIREELTGMIQNDLDKKLDELSDTLKLETLRNTTKKVLSAFNDFKKEIERKRISPAYLTALEAQRKKAANEFFNDHKDVLEQLDALGTLKADDVQDEEKKKRYFGVTEEVPDEGITRSIAPESLELLSLQKNIDKLFKKAIIPVREEFYPEEKRAREEQ